MNNFHIRQWSGDTVQDFIELRQKIVSECPYMLLTPEEADENTSQQKQSTLTLIESPHRLLLGAWGQREFPVGFALFTRHANRKSIHRASLVIGTLREVHGTGAAHQLFDEGLKWLRKNHIIRLDLTVVSENLRAISFYRRKGFEIEGKLIKSIKQPDGQLLDELSMSMILNAGS